MSKFKVGDRVKTIFGSGEIVEINEEISCPYLVCHDIWNRGHNGNGKSKKEYFGNHCLWFLENMLVLLKPIITVDDLSEDYENIEKKEGNDMIESLNLVDLYASKQIEKIESETNKKVEELKGKCEIINKFNELIEKFKKDCDELYLSQFTEEEKSEILLDKEPVDDRDKQLIRNKAYLYDYHTNDDFKPSEYYDLMNERNKEINKINELVKTVKAHVGIAKTKEEVEEILTRYEILDKKGKLKIRLISLLELETYAEMWS